MLVNQLREQWRMRQASVPVSELPSFSPEGLILGAGTVLAKGRSDVGRLEALLTVAYGRSIAVEALAHVKTAVDRWGAGDRVRAELHLALARLGPVEGAADVARRLFMAEGLMKAGLKSDALLDALGFEEPAETLKYDGQPRIPKGNRSLSGRWTTGRRAGSAGSGGSRSHRSKTRTLGQPSPAANHRPSAANAAALAADGGLDLAALSGEAAGAVASFVEAVAATGVAGAAIAVGGAAAALGIVVIPSTGPKGEWVNVGGAGKVSYFRQPDETAIGFRYTDAKGIQRTLSVSPDPDGNYRDPRGNTIAKWVKTAAGVSLLVSAATLAGDSDDPKLCPAAEPDKKGPRDNNRDYEDFVKAMINHPPTPRAYAYGFINPVTGNHVVIDDCQHSTGALFEYKGAAFDRLLRYSQPGDGVTKKFLDQALRQVQASKGRPLTWVFAERDAAEKTKALFRASGEGRERINIIWIPMPKGGS